LRQRVLGRCCQEPAQLAQSHGRRAGRAQVSGHGLSRVAARCLDEKASVGRSSLRELPGVPPQPWALPLAALWAARAQV